MPPTVLLTEVTMPRLSDSMEEGTIVRWVVDDGAEVAPGDEIVEIETDKATIAYESDAAGILHVVAAAGETVPLGARIALIVPPGTDPTEIDGPAGRVRASPLARRIARDLAIDLATVRGTGRHGRIIRIDVEAIHAQAAPVVAAAAATPAPPTEPEAPSSKGAIEIVELTRLQAVVARRMAEAKASAPEFVLRREVDMEAAVELRETLRGWALDAPPPSYNDMVVRAAALALRAHPRANGAFRDGRFELYERVNVGFAVAAEDALLVPTIFDADRKSLGQIARDARDLAGRARSGRITPPELSGGTFSVSNLGMFGVDGFTAVLNPPQAAILAVGALAQRAVVHEGAVVVRHRMELSLTCDHRILYGAQAAELLAAIAENLEHPGTLVL